MERDIEKWQAYLDKELSEADKHLVEIELAENPDKRNAYEEFRCKYQQTYSLFASWQEPQFDVESNLTRLQPFLTKNTKANRASYSMWLGWGSLATAVAVMLLFVFNPAWLGILPEDKGSGIQLPSHWKPKGFSMRMLHQHKGKKNSRHTRNGTILHPGDFVQFTYVSSQSQHVMIVSITDKGVLSRYIPLERENSQLLQEKRGTLPKREAIELDGALGNELFLLLTAKSPFSYADVKKAILQAFQKNKKNLQGLQFEGKLWKVYKTILIRKTKLSKKSIP